MLYLKLKGNASVDKRSEDSPPADAHFAKKGNKQTGDRHAKAHSLEGEEASGTKLIRNKGRRK